VIRRLRDRHRRMIPLLALLAALALAIALLERSNPARPDIPPALRQHSDPP
jgi:hypothetical protein